MTILSIRTVGDPVLRSVCDPITVFDDDLARLIDDMLETMYDVGGVGLAGPQVGISKQIFTFGGIDDRATSSTPCSKSAKKTRKAAKAACPCPARSPRPRARTGRA